MARARIVHQAADGSAIEVSFEVGTSYPDACREAVARALDLWFEMTDSDEDAAEIIERLELDSDGGGE